MREINLEEKYEMKLQVSAPTKLDGSKNKKILN